MTVGPGTHESEPELGERGSEALERVVDRHLLVVEVTARRADQPAYQAYVDILNSRIVARGAEAGFRVTRVGAADIGAEALLDLAASADAIVIAGGEDIAPSFYGAAAGYPFEGRHNEKADQAQISLVHRAIESRIPLLGICRGHQIINVALGGTLRQDLGSESIHRNADVPIDRTMSSHSVELRADSALARAFGDDHLEVQSAHHQSLDRIGRDLSVVGIAPDGTPEAVEHRERAVFGVQWHPEDPGAPKDQLPRLIAALDAAVSGDRNGRGERLDIAS